VAHRPPTSPRRIDPKRILGLVIGLVLGGIWLYDTSKGIPPPPALGQGLVAAAVLLGHGGIGHK
jgi:hypothetical protein